MMVASAAPAATAAETKPQECNPFREGDLVVYPTHGIGRVERVAFEETAGHRLNPIRIWFTDNKMTLRVPLDLVRAVGLRRLAGHQLIAGALAKLKGRPWASRLSVLASANVWLRNSIVSDFVVRLPQRLCRHAY